MIRCIIVYFLLSALPDLLFFASSFQDYFLFSFFFLPSQLSARLIPLFTLAADAIEHYADAFAIDAAIRHFDADAMMRTLRHYAAIILYTLTPYYAITLPLYCFHYAILPLLITLIFTAPCHIAMPDIMLTPC